MKTAQTRARRAPNGAVSDKPVAVRLHLEELERFKSRAAREQRSMASVVRLDDYEDGLVQTMANYQGEQLATLLRELALPEARQVLGLVHEPSLDQRAA